MAICKVCGREYDEDEVRATLEEEFDDVYEMVSEVRGMCEDCANTTLDSLARAGQDYMDGN